VRGNWHADPLLARPRRNVLFESQGEPGAYSREGERSYKRSGIADVGSVES